MIRSSFARNWKLMNSYRSMYFALADENTVYRFEITMSFDDFREWSEEFCDAYADFVSEQENYGVLDVSSDGETELYCSYEIEPHEFPVVLENFQRWFKKMGLPVVEGSVETLNANDVFGEDDE